MSCSCPRPKHSTRRRCGTADASDSRRVRTGDDHRPGRGLDRAPAAADRWPGGVRVGRATSSTRTPSGWSWNDGERCRCGRSSNLSPAVGSVLRHRRTAERAGVRIHTGGPWVGPYDRWLLTDPAAFCPYRRLGDNRVLIAPPRTSRHGSPRGHRPLLDRTHRGRKGDQPHRHRPLRRRLRAQHPRAVPSARPSNRV
jgi:hypothetical protein